LRKPCFFREEQEGRFFLTFPIEIGIFISDRGDKNLQLLDVLSLARQKFTLYGEVSNGVLLQALEKQGIFITSFPLTLCRKGLWN